MKKDLAIMVRPKVLWERKGKFMLCSKHNITINEGHGYRLATKEELKELIIFEDLK